MSLFRTNIANIYRIISRSVPRRYCRWLFFVILSVAGSKFVHIFGWTRFFGDNMSTLPVKPMYTVWGENLDKTNVLSEYPRPGLVRERWLNLNGVWEYAIEKTPSVDFKAEGSILVPFCVESQLSMVAKTLHQEETLLYRREFSIPADWKENRLRLNFEAADYKTTVLVNGKEVGQHSGGYDAFSFDITDFVDFKKEKQTLVVFIWDPTDKQAIPVGKQWSSGDRDGRFIYYEATSGIWQTVWLEPVPRLSVDNLIINTNIDTGDVSVNVETFAVDAAANSVLSIKVTFDGKEVVSSVGQPGQKQLVFNVGKEAHLWTPDQPNLYNIEVILQNENSSDKVFGYFGMRKIETKMVNGSMKVFLNNEHLRFQNGPLDQGYWPDGLLTAPSEEALLWDIQKMKEMGFNMVRKHIKIECRRWYYWTDKLGLIVWQDFPAISDQHNMEKLPAAQANFKREFRRWMRQLHNHPSIVLWVVFNEAWGQHNTVQVTREVMELDPSRLVTCASGWTDAPAGHVVDKHPYPGPTNKDTDPENLDPKRIFVVGEWWGMSLIVLGHCWFGDDAAQADPRGGVKSKAEFMDKYTKSIHQLMSLRERSSCPYTAACVTQLTDVEGEFNGFFTYDRRVEKVPAMELAELHRKLLV